MSGLSIQNTKAIIAFQKRKHFAGSAGLTFWKMTHRIFYEAVSYGLLGIISMSVFSPGQKDKKRQTPQKKHTQQGIKQDFWFNGFHRKLMSTVDSTASSYAPRLNALQLDEQRYRGLKFQPVNASLPMKPLNSHNKCSQVKVSNLNNFCSLYSRALKFSHMRSWNQLSAKSPQYGSYLVWCVFLLCLSLCVFFTHALCRGCAQHWVDLSIIFMFWSSVVK